MIRTLFQINSSVRDEDAGQKKKDHTWPTEMGSRATVQMYKQDC